MQVREKLILQLIICIIIILFLVFKLVYPGIRTAVQSGKTLKSYQLEILKYDSTIGEVTKISDPVFKTFFDGDNDLPNQKISCTYNVFYTFKDKQNRSFSDTIFDEHQKSVADKTTKIDSCSFFNGQSIKIFYDKNHSQIYLTESEYRYFTRPAYGTSIGKFWYIISGIGLVLLIVCLIWLFKIIQQLKKRDNKI